MSYFIKTVLEIGKNYDGICPTEQFEFQVTMQWEDAVRLASCETILVDLDNYTKEEVAEVKITVLSDITNFSERHIEVFRVDRMTLMRTPIYHTDIKREEDGKCKAEFILKKKKSWRLFFIFLKKS